MKKSIVLLLLCALCLTLTGCGDALLRRTYSTSAPHSAAYWENEDADTLRAENYQDLVNALLLLLSEHGEGGVVRLYGDLRDKSALAGEACLEVQRETPIGAYLLDYITYEGKSESSYFELTVRFGYRRTAEEQKAIVNATSMEALPDLLRAALRDGRDAVAIRFVYFPTDRAGVNELIRAVHDELYPPEPPAAAQPDEAGGESGEDAPGEDTPGENAPGGDTSGEDAPGGDVPGGEAGESAADAETPPEELPAQPDIETLLAPWTVVFYPDDRPGIVEVRFNNK